MTLLQAVLSSCTLKGILLASFFTLAALGLTAVTKGFATTMLKKWYNWFQSHGFNLFYTLRRDQPHAPSADSFPGNHQTSLAPTEAGSYTTETPVVEPPTSKPRPKAMTLSGGHIADRKVPQWDWNNWACVEWIYANLKNWERANHHDGYNLDMTKDLPKKYAIRFRGTGADLYLMDVKEWVELFGEDWSLAYKPGQDEYTHRSQTYGVVLYESICQWRTYSNAPPDAFAPRVRLY